MSELRGLFREVQSSFTEQKTPEDNRSIDSRWNMDLARSMIESLFQHSDRPKAGSEAAEAGLSKELTESSLKEADIMQLSDKLSTSESIVTMMENHPEKIGSWKIWLNAFEVMNDCDASPLEKRSANAVLNHLKGQLVETAAKDILSQRGFSVEAKQRTVGGESGRTRPDVIAFNNTSLPLGAFGQEVKPGEAIYCECKCGRQEYLKSQLENHIPNQLSGHEGHGVLIVTSDIKEIAGMAENVCKSYGSELNALHISAGSIENALKEVARNEAFSH